MNARIRRDDIVAFKAQAAAIKPPTDLQPILKYLKIDIVGDFCSVTKTDNKSFIVKNIGNDSEDCCFLIDENVLYSFIEYSGAEYINFEIEGQRIILSDGRGKVHSPTESPRGYPPIDLSNSEWHAIPKVALVAAGVASAFIFNGEVFNAKSFVCMGNNGCGGSDASIGFYQSFVDAVPAIMLRREVAQCISKMSACRYSSNLSYDIFTDGDTTFGFVKSDINFFDLGKWFTPVVDGLPSFSINKNAVIKWLKLCTSTSQTKGIAATFSCNVNNSLHFEMVDGKMGIDVHDDIPMRGEEGEFKFDPALLTTLLTNVPCEECVFYAGPQLYYITDFEKSFMSIIMLII